MKSSLNINNFIQKEKIGEGTFGEVYKVKDKTNKQIYAAKILFKHFEDNLDEEKRDLFREVNILSKINHPSIMKFIGFSSINFLNEPKPVIITELVNNGSLFDIINLERKSLIDFEWNITRKLIIIYGIASAMSFLHAHKIIHRDLKPENILMDDFLCPKVADFGFSKIFHSNLESMSITDSTQAVKGTPIYIAPEIWTNKDYGPSCDVYSFGLITYEIITGEEPFKSLQIYELPSKVVNGERPIINNFVPDSYKDLIESCWSSNPEDRPSFDEIVEKLRNDSGFITPEVDKDDFYDFIEYIDQYPTTFNSEKNVVSIDEFVKRKSQTFNKVSINKKLIKGTIIEEESARIYPGKEFNSLPENLRDLVEESDKNPEKQFEIGQSLIEGKNGFDR